jgi:TRAP-type mannitol/chloroaromatic compound transport system permease small subunit
MSVQNAEYEVTPTAAWPDSIDRWILRVGHFFSWANGLLILVTLLQVVLRYGFGRGFVVLEELEWHLYAVAFMIGLSYALTTNSHVRVDLLQAGFSRRTRAWIDLVGHLVLLLPFVVACIYYGWEFFELSWIHNERSSAPLGLPARWLIKGVIPVSMALLGLATISKIIRAIGLIRSQRHGA